MTTDRGRRRLGAAVRRARLERGWTKEQAARTAEISSITWKRVEDGLSVQDVKMRAVEKALGWQEDQSTAVMAGTAEKIREALDPRPVGLGLDSAADGLTPDQIESVRAVILAMKQNLST